MGNSGPIKGTPKPEIQPGTLPDQGASRGQNKHGTYKQTRAVEFSRNDRSSGTSPRPAPAGTTRTLPKRRNLPADLPHFPVKGSGGDPLCYVFPLAGFPRTHQVEWIRSSPITPAQFHRIPRTGLNPAIRNVVIKPYRCGPGRPKTSAGPNEPPLIPWAAEKGPGAAARPTIAVFLADSQLGPRTAAGDLRHRTGFAPSRRGEWTDDGPAP